MKSKFAIETTELTKNYGKILALDHVDLSIDYGEIFGLLGPNGAGKTTIISLLCTINNPSYGTAFVNGFNITRQPDKVRRSIGIVFQDPSIDDRLTGRENLQIHCTLYDIPAQLSKKRIKELLDLVGLSERADSPVKTYSGGMRRRLELARGLLHSPKILFLDEPTLGLDPQTRQSLWEHIENMARQEKITVVLTTHYMEEAERLCSRIGIIDYGRVKVVDTPSNLISQLKGDVLTVVTDYAPELQQKLRELSIKYTSELHDDRIRIQVSEAEKIVPQIVEIATTSNLKIKSVSIHKPTLNDVFLHFTGREIREEDAENSFRIHMRAASRMR